MFLQVFLQLSRVWMKIGDRRRKVTWCGSFAFTRGTVNAKRRKYKKQTSYNPHWTCQKELLASSKWKCGFVAGIVPARCCCEQHWCWVCSKTQLRDKEEMRPQASTLHCLCIRKTLDVFLCGRQVRKRDARDTTDVRRSPFAQKNYLKPRPWTTAEFFKMPRQFIFHTHKGTKLSAKIWRQSNSHCALVNEPWQSSSFLGHSLKLRIETNLTSVLLQIMHAECFPFRESSSVRFSRFSELHFLGAAFGFISSGLLAWCTR